MVRILIKTDTLLVGERSCPVRYFEVSTARGARRFSAEILVGPDDRIILDADSLMTLETRALRLVPATVYSRMLARATAA